MFAISAGKIGAAAVAVGLALAFTNWTDRAAEFRGVEKELGAGTVQSYVTTDAQGAPTAVGVSLSATALQKLPAQTNTTSRCHDVDGNGAHAHGECLGDYELILEIPDAVVAKGVPFRWVGVNWNPQGHMVPTATPYPDAHFDFHFYTAERSVIQGIAPGPCAEYVDCDDFKRASKPVAPEYMPPGHIDVGAVVPKMGNHLLDSKAPEMQKPPLPFTRTFIYGAFDGELIFWEPMVTREFLQRRGSECFPISRPAKYRRPGFYPAEYCVKFDARTQRHTVSLERFAYFQGS